MTDDLLNAIRRRKAELQGQAIDNMAGSTTTRSIYNKRMDAIQKRKAFLMGNDTPDDIDTTTGLQDNWLRAKMGFASTPELYTYCHR